MTTPTNPTPSTDPGTPAPASTAPVGGKPTPPTDPAAGGGDEGGTESPQESSKGTISNVR